MKRASSADRLASLLLLIVLVTGCVTPGDFPDEYGFPAAPADAQGTAPDFSLYPQTKAFSECLHSHLSPRNADVLYVTVCLFGDKGARQYVVDALGREADQFVSYVWFSVKNTHQRYLNDSERKQLSEAVARQFSQKSVMPPAERLVVVSWKAGTEWITRSYDHAALPDSVGRLLDTLNGSNGFMEASVMRAMRNQR